jgi:hypothetical protein
MRRVSLETVSEFISASSASIISRDQYNVKTFGEKGGLEEKLPVVRKK